MATVERVEGALPRWRLSQGPARVEVAPSRGALVTDFTVEGDRLLFLDEATLLDESKNVRGGVPLLFPFAGKPPPGSPLPQHGFARKRAWEVLRTDGALELRLRDDEQTRESWPHAFELRFAITLSADARLRLEWTLHNPGDTPLPLHFGIHPYFRVEQKARARVDGAAGRAFDNTRGADVDVERIDFSAGEVDLHFAASPGGTVLHRGEERPVHLSWTPQFDTLVVWTQPGKPFICVEPWAGRGGVPTTRFVAPGATEVLAVELWRGA